MIRRAARGMFGRVSCLVLAFALALAFPGVVAYGAHPFDALFIIVLSAGPAIVVSAIIAGIIASYAAKSEAPWSRSNWVTRGVVCGALSGALSLGGWFVAMNISDGMPPHLLVVGVTAAGALAGALVGLGLALYCWYAVQSRLAG